MNKFLVVALALPLALGFSGITSAAPTVDVFMEYITDFEHGDYVPIDPTPNDFTATVNIGETFYIGMYLNTDLTEYSSGDYLYVAMARITETTVSPIFEFVGGTRLDESPHELWSIANPDTDMEHSIGYACEEYQVGDGKPDGNVLFGAMQLKGLALGKADFITEFLHDPPWTTDGEFETYNYVNLNEIVTFHNGEISVVPIPGTVLLLGSGLVGLVCLRRRFLG